MPRAFWARGLGPLAWPSVTGLGKWVRERNGHCLRGARAGTVARSAVSRLTLGLGWWAHPRICAPHSRCPPCTEGSMRKLSDTRGRRATKTGTQYATFLSDSPVRLEIPPLVWIYRPSCRVNPQSFKASLLPGYPGHGRRVWSVRFRRLGLDVEKLCAQIDIDIEVFLDATGRAPRDSSGRLWRAALDESGDRFLGLSAAEEWEARGGPSRLPAASEREDVRRWGHGEHSLSRASLARSRPHPRGAPPIPSASHQQDRARAPRAGA